jgi:nucleotide-binding universal stress UspA family protein
MGIVSVVVGIDGTESSDHAMHFAIGLAARESARLTACFVSHPLIVTYPVGLVPVDFEAYATALDDKFADALEMAGVCGGCFYHRKGDAVVELKRLADEQHADIIAVGRSRHPHLHVGSVPRRLLDTSAHAVLIVP